MLCRNSTSQWPASVTSHLLSLLQRSDAPAVWGHRPLWGPHPLTGALPLHRPSSCSLAARASWRCRVAASAEHVFSVLRMRALSLNLK